MKATGHHEMKPTSPPMSFDDTLFQRLRMANRADLDALLKDLKKDPCEYKDYTDAALVLAISKALRTAAAWSLDDIHLADHEFPYKKILVDVADKLNPGFGWTDYKVSGPESEMQIEDYIYEQVLILMEKYFASLNDADKAKLQADIEADLRARGLPEQVVRGALSSLAAGTLAGITIGPIVASAIFGSLWTWLFGLSLGQLILGGFAVGGPVGLVVAALMVASGPSYSKTIPAVTRLIQIRLSHEAEAKLESTQ
jgi:uncharacterized protein YaaW (UPF0174 family)